MPTCLGSTFTVSSATDVIQTTANVGVVVTVLWTARETRRNARRLQRLEQAILADWLQQAGISVDGEAD